MENWIVNNIIKIINNVTTVGSDLIKTPESFNEVIYNGILNIQKTVITPIALVILAIFLLLELQSITTRTDNMGEKGFEIPFKLMFKFIICKTALEMTPLILTAIFTITQDIIVSVNSILAGSGGISIDEARNSIEALVNSAGFWEKILIMMNVLILYVISFFASILMTAIIYGRMIEMYIFIAVAPLPMATIPNAEHSSIAKNFLKSFTAVSIQGVLICISIAIMGILFGEIVTIDISKIDSSSLQSLLWECTGYSIMSLFAVLSSGKWAKSICNAM